jgi:uncharacterized membrane protein YgcG
MTLMLVLPFCTVNASAVNTAAGWSGDSSLSAVEDDAGVFVEHADALEQLNESAKKYSEKLQMNIYVLIAGPDRRMSDSEEREFCDQTYDERFGNDTDGVFLFIDMTGKRPAYDYLSTYGTAILFYQEHVDEILDAACSYLPSSDSFSTSEDYSYDVKYTINAFFNQLEKYQKDFRAGLKYYYDPETHKYIYYFNGELKITKFKPPAVYLRALLMALAGGGIVHLIAYFVAKSKYKLKAKTDPNIYLSKEETRFNFRTDDLIRSYTSKSRISSSSGGGYHGGGHRSGGGSHHSGGSHGGGGRHR